MGKAKKQKRRLRDLRCGPGIECGSDCHGAAGEPVEVVRCFHDGVRGWHVTELLNRESNVRAVSYAGPNREPVATQVESAVYVPRDAFITPILMAAQAAERKFWVYVERLRGGDPPVDGAETHYYPAGARGLFS